jgi:hypothetical protein
MPCSRSSKRVREWGRGLELSGSNGMQKLYIESNTHIG